MKNILFIFIILLLFDCNKKSEEIKKVPTKKMNMNEQNILNCSNSEKRAFKDLKNNKLIYIKYIGMFGYMRSEKEFREILSKYKIEFKIGEVGSCHPEINDGEYCYAQIMEKEIVKNFGKTFLDSIKKCADKQYIINNPNQVFSIKECDEMNTFPNPKNGEDFWEKPSKEFNAKFIYPKKYIKCRDEFDNLMDAKFILNKNGTIDSLKIETEFLNPKNNEFKKYIETKAKEYIENKKWNPIKRLGTFVNTEIELTFDLK